jgi:hypothetical protein
MHKNCKQEVKAGQISAENSKRSVRILLTAEDAIKYCAKFPAGALTKYRSIGGWFAAQAEFAKT